MSLVVNIDNINYGAPPYTINICDIQQNVCVYAGTIYEDTSMPYTFPLPVIYENTNFLIKLTDDNLCEYIKYIT